MRRKNDGLFIGTFLVISLGWLMTYPLVGISNAFKYGTDLLEILLFLYIPILIFILVGVSLEIISFKLWKRKIEKIGDGYK
jgi:hypothetical protein